jgi:acyl carrier protein
MSSYSSEHRSTIREFINDILQRKPGGEPVGELKEDLSLTQDLGLESLDLAELTVKIEDEYGVDIFENELIDTVGEVLQKVEDT